MVGSALRRRLASEGCEILTADRTECDLLNQEKTLSWLDANRPDAVFMAAAKVGGILANDTNPVDFLYENLMIAGNVIHGCHEVAVEKLLFLGSSCIYPKMAPQPIREEYLLTGPLEPTNEWYAVAKIAGIKLCQAYMKQHGRRFISAMPTNLYGPFDNFDLKSSHVLPALMRKAHEAKSAGQKNLDVWGSGKPMREFLHVDDLADACVHVMKVYEDYEHINIGSGTDIAISEVARTIMDVVGLEGDLVFDTSKPDGTPRKLMAADKLRSLGWSPSIELKAGLQQTYEWFLENVSQA